MGNLTSKLTPFFRGTPPAAPATVEVDDENVTVASQLSRSQLRLGASMLRAPVDAEFVLSRADKGSKEARRRPVVYEQDPCIEEDKVTTPYQGVTRAACDTPTYGITRCAIVDKDGFVQVKNFETRKERAEPHRFRPIEDCRGIESNTRRFPKTFQAPATPRMLAPKPVPPALLEDFNRLV